MNLSVLLISSEVEVRKEAPFIFQFPLLHSSRNLLPHNYVPLSCPKVCPTRPDYVAPLLNKMTSMDVVRLSKGRPAAKSVTGEAVDGSGEASGAAAAKAAAAATAATAAAAKRNDGAAISAARDRFLQRKAGGGAGQGQGRK